MKTITNEILSTVTGGAGGAPLSGDVNQQINTNWGGTQIINEAPKQSNSLVERMRTDPVLRFEQQRRLSTPVHRGR